MFFGGTNFGQTSGGPNYVTSYDYGAPIDEYGLLSQPKWGHLKDLNAALKLCEPALVAADSAQYINLGSSQEAHVYRGDNTSICSAFLANIDEHKSSTIQFLGRSYTLPPWSVSILPDCKNAVLNTAKIPASFSLQLGKGDLDLPLKRHRKLLNTEKLIFKNDEKSGTYVVLTVEPEGVVAIPNAKEREMVVYNIVCDELVVGIPHKAWWVVILAVVCLVVAFVIPSFLPSVLVASSEDRTRGSPSKNY